MKTALDEAINKIDRNTEILGEEFPVPATRNNLYAAMDNTEWTNGFWTGVQFVIKEN
ncbi:hypothetical protein [Mesobacillus zeae]|uniref:hypothetical protein n=1 Tax=Mesobacillus zeae TaxID=1917180 RepID=UPI0015E723B9|nr:hypothetical protein [Mesobacillus zeae]